MSKLTGNEVFIEATTGEYPLSFYQVRRKLPNVVFGSEVSAAQLIPMGFEVVAQVERPEGDVVVSLPPAKVNGAYVHQYEVRSFNAQELAGRLEQTKRNLISRVERNLTRSLEKGFAHDFGGDTGVQHVQLRDGDRANLAGMRAMATDFPDQVQPFRTHENNMLTLTAQQVTQMTQAAHGGYLALLGAAWQLKDAIEAAASEADLPEVPEAI